MTERDSLKRLRLCTDRILAIAITIFIPIVTVLAYALGQGGGAPVCTGTGTGAYPQLISGSWPFAFVNTSLLSIGSILFLYFYPGRFFCRVYHAIALMVLCGLVIHFSGGMSEAHLLVFIALSSLLFYRDKKVILLATAVLTLHYLLFYALQTSGIPVVLFSCPSNASLAIHLISISTQGGLLCWIAHLMRRDIAKLSLVKSEIQKKAELYAIELQANNQTLDSSLDLAKSATRAKSDFLENMCQRIYTPMNAIMGISHLVLKTSLTPRQRDYIDKIRASSQQLLEVINDSLDFSEIETGKLKVESVTFYLENVLGSISSQVSEKAFNKGLELIFDVAPNVPRYLIGDPMRISQIILNYIGNAIKFTDRGEIVLTIQIREVNDLEVLLYFAVKDTGVGLPAEHKARLFHAFKRANDTDHNTEVSSGLGLAISKQLANLMGGTVGVESVEGQGSTFWFTVLLGVSSSPSPLIPTIDLGERHVLVVDDSIAARAVLKRLLERLQFRVESASTGREALMKLSSRDQQELPIEIIYLDGQMPGSNGIEISEAISQLNLKNPPKLIMITGSGKEDVRRKIKNANVSSILVKPISESLLYDATISALGLETPEQPNPISPDDEEFESIEKQLASVSSARVLLVEAHELNQNIGYQLLTDVGLEVDLAGNGQIALDMVQQFSYDIVLMALQMPIMDGATATQKIRALAQFEKLIIVGMSASSMQSTYERCVTLGMNDHIRQPIVPEELWLTLLKWITPRSSVTLGESSDADFMNNSALLPGEINGLNISVGLKLAQGKHHLYLERLQEFCQTHRNTSKSIYVALKNQDWTTVKKLVQSVRGLAGNIGANYLEELSNHLELAVGDNPLPSMIGQANNLFQNEINHLIAELDLHIPSIADARAKLCQTLVELLENRSINSLDFLQNHQDDFRLAFSQHFDTLIHYCDRYNYGEALALIQELQLAHPPEICNPASP